MTVKASDKDKAAYKQIGGALDNLSDAYTYIGKFLSTANDARDPLKDLSGMTKFLKYAGKAQRIYSYATKIKDTLDEKKRDGALLKLGIKVSMDIAAKLLGTSLTTHPYYAYHKAQIDALADALNASRNAREAVNAYRRAVAAANSSAVAAEFKRVESNKIDTVVKHFDFKDKIGVAADIARGAMSEDFARKQIAKYGQDTLSNAMADLEAWRANWSGLAFDALQVQIMMGNEMNVATEAMDKVKDLIKTLMDGSNTSRVLGFGAQNNIDWEKYDQIVNQKQPQQLYMDPIKFAQANYDKAAAWAQAFSDMCDFVRSDDVVFSTKFNLQLDALNKVLYP